jgi:hypothetical protein
MRLTFTSASDLARALRQAADAHDQHEKQIGRPDPDWPDWYAEYMMRTLGEGDDRPGESEAHQRRARSRD